MLATISVFKLLYNEYMNETMDEVVNVKLPEDLIDRFQYASLNIVEGKFYLFTKCMGDKFRMYSMFGSGVQITYQDYFNPVNIKFCYVYPQEGKWYKRFIDWLEPFLQVKSNQELWDLVKALNNE